MNLPHEPEWDDDERDRDDGYCACGAVHTPDEIAGGMCDCCGGKIDDDCE